MSTLMTVEQYHELIRTGILVDGDPIELLEGWLVQKMTKYPPRSVATFETRRVLERFIREDWWVDSQEPITMPDSEPEPDVSVVRGRRRDYVDRHPGPEDVALLVEVADTSLERDRGGKKRIYAAAGIPCYWIVNLIDRQVEVHTQPSGSGEQADYATCQIYQRGESIPVALDDAGTRTIAVDELLP